MGPTIIKNILDMTFIIKFHLHAEFAQTFPVRHISQEEIQIQFPSIIGFVGGNTIGNFFNVRVGSKMPIIEK